ncbi:MAG: OmpA family protein, partial [Bacteroidota bacterium]
PAPQKPIEFADASTDEPASASPGQKMVTSSPEPHKLKVLPQVKATYQEKTLESEAPTPVKVTKAPAQKIICTNLVSDHKDLQPIYFQSNSDILTQEAKDRLDKVASMLHECDQAQLVVQGHADALGGLRDNLVLSVMRAYNVKYYLVYERGVSQSRITSGGLGEGKPIADNQSSSGRQLNRRVDFSFVF